MIFDGEKAPMRFILDGVLYPYEASCVFHGHGSFSFTKEFEGLHMTTITLVISRARTNSNETIPF